MKRTIEVEDTLQERVDSAIEDVTELLRTYIKENEPQDVPCLWNDLDHDGSVHEIVDTAVPIYHHEIDTAWYLYGNQIEEAYENAGKHNARRWDCPADGLTRGHRHRS